MTQMTQLRVLRLKHGVTLVEMGRAARMSNQQLSRLELGVRPRTEQREERVRAGRALTHWNTTTLQRGAGCWRLWRWI